MEKLKLKLIAEDFEEEAFYEEIEAPKFVDLTRSDRFLPDDRYWFCSRVGCDLKHEEELDLEAISKDFVLRAMAARSPNLRFQKALSKRQNETKKCPLSAPPKPSKPRIPKMALLSSVSRKLVDTKDTAQQPPPKPTSTPKARVKHVAAKYMTTPRVKKPVAESKPFSSVRNQPTTSSRILRPKLVAKALFSSPRKAIKAKTHENQSSIPIKKLCGGMKKLEITDQKKSTTGELRSARVCKKKVLGNSKIQEEDEKTSRIVSSKAKGVAQKKANTNSVLCEVAIGDNTEARSCSAGPCSKSSKPEDGEVTICSSDGVSDEAATCGSNWSQEATKERILVEAGRAEENYSNEGSGSDQIPSCDEKENAPCCDINRNFTVDHGQSGGDSGVKQNTSKKTATMNKISLKENRSGGIQGVKYKKQKTTNPKPFRLRTDERSILKEATLERKQQEDENQVQSEGRLHTGINKSKKNQEVTKTPNRSTSTKDKLASFKSQQKDAKDRIYASTRSTCRQKCNQRTLQRARVSQAKPEGNKACSSLGKKRGQPPTTTPKSCCTR